MNNVITSYLPIFTPLISVSNWLTPLEKSELTMVTQIIICPRFEEDGL